MFHWTRLLLNGSPCITAAAPELAHKLATPNAVAVGRACAEPYACERSGALERPMVAWTTVSRWCSVWHAIEQRMPQMRRRPCCFFSLW
jgi:hypothetical protein